MKSHHTLLLRVFFCVALSSWLAGCAQPGIGTAHRSDVAQADRAPRALQRLLPADVLLLGEQHDVPAHQRIHAQVVAALAASDQLAALALEMAEAGRSSAGLPRDADDPAIRRALAWDDRAWPWAAYGPAVVAAVRAGAPVVGANLPRASQRAAMADVSLDAQLDAAGWASQLQAIRDGHCRALPEAQTLPMTRVQVARDRAMAHAVAESVRPGKTVLLLTGAAHADKRIGVPQHLALNLRVKSVLLQARAVDAPPDEVIAHDAVWRTGAEPPAPDRCAALRK